MMIRSHFLLAAAIMTMNLFEIDWPPPWGDACHRPDPVEPDAEKRLRMQQSFHMAMRYNGKKNGGNEEREALMALQHPRPGDALGLCQVLQHCKI